MSTSEMTGESAREALRREHSVRLVSSTEEGSAAGQLPAGVYGFTGSPALESPLFAQRRRRTFEVHHLPNGTVALVGFVTSAEASRLMNGATDTPVTVTVHPDVDGEATVIVSLPYDRIAHHRQYLVRPEAAITIHVLPTGQPLSV
jgi:hypothetical protein